MHPQEATPIEVEVVEVDGIAPVRTAGPSDENEPRHSGGGIPDWRQWGGRVRTLDSRGWPLWVILGSIALFLALTVGVVLGLIYAVFRVVRGLLRALFR